MFEHGTEGVIRIGMGHIIDRDLSQIEFHRRVLDEARDEANPLLERVKFLGILGTIVDEFAADRRPLAEAFSLLDEARRFLRNDLSPLLAAHGIRLLPCADLQAEEREAADAYFRDAVLPLLMPLGYDATHPFPHIKGGRLALAVVLRDGDDQRLACLELPAEIPALLPVKRDGEHAYVWTHDLVAANLGELFPGTEILAVHRFKILRDTTLHVALTDGVALRDVIEDGLRRREFGAPIMLTIDAGAPAWLIELFATHLDLSRDAIQVSEDFVDLVTLLGLSDIKRPELQNQPLVQRRAPARLFDRIRRGDMLLHHPFDSFDTVVDFISEAAADPDVLAISSTLYRTGRNSPIVDALLAAQRAGKRVRAVIEVRARFDESFNLAWGYALEQAGAHVVYGLPNFKVHAKTTLVVRREGGVLRRYVHLSSGNYNRATSTVYTDIGLLTCRESICRDATQIFNLISGYGSPSGFESLLVAPFTLRKRVTELIEREARWAERGLAAHMILKMNALADPHMIDHLYDAAQAGVHIDLIVRGICCLRPGVPGLSDSIRVRSIVGRFLEHSRAWYFRNGGKEEVYIGSADLMTRNLDERVEIMVPIEDVDLKQRIHREILGAYLADNVKARELRPDGRYVRATRRDDDAAVNCQEYFQ